ncbi:outer membrane protein assembly factor [Aestuariibacter halophilus]|uniref:Outer membrane protein assembly factor n=1 Tax=Fluctibacter halophilus TaxID=226011 RepID=A0ABS8GBG8_9ALTE|nr:outer membrane protein assembly factor [Aestuariibacter halophilus]MCC2617079.1 outer membrane protein assembly factor [Aestuariibacter halophilus]
MLYRSLFGLLIVHSTTALADQQPPPCADTSQDSITVDHLRVINHAIFDEQHPDYGWLHQFANWMHIRTEPDVVEERLPFAQGDTVASDDLAEAERLIRAQPYIRDANVRLVSQCDAGGNQEVVVETWDNWSLLPTISFGRTSGTNTLALGIKEDNFLGKGIRTRIRYNDDNQRSGFQGTLLLPVSFIPHSTLLLDYQQNDDGQSRQVVFDNPFYQTQAKHMFRAEALQLDAEQTYYQNGETRNHLNQQQHRYALSAGWRVWHHDNWVARLMTGVVDEEYMFTIPVDRDPSEQLWLPQDRHYRFGWLGISLLESDYRALQDIHLIGQTEDINLGWHGTVKVGIEQRNQPQEGAGGQHVMLDLNSGTDLGNGWLFWSLNGYWQNGISDEDHAQISTQLEYIQRLSPLFSSYTRVATTRVNHPFADQPLVIDGDTGVRGYPLQYQHGDRRWSASAELRMYPQTNLWQLLDVGYAAFVDVGRANGGADAHDNEQSGPLASVGAGVRLYSSRSSHRSVIHMDVIKPLSSGPGVDSWEWRLEVKQRF